MRAVYVNEATREEITQLDTAVFQPERGDVIFTPDRKVYKILQRSIRIMSQALSGTFRAEMQVVVTEVKPVEAKLEEAPHAVTE